MNVHEELAYNYLIIVRNYTLLELTLALTLILILAKHNKN